MPRARRDKDAELQQAEEAFVFLREYDVLYVTEPPYDAGNPPNQQPWSVKIDWPEPQPIKIQRLCPMCDGEGCAPCEGTGRITIETREMSTKEKKIYTDLVERDKKWHPE